MAGEFSPIKIDLFHQNKLDQQLFLQIFSQVFEK